MSTAIRIGLDVRSKCVIANFDREIRSPGPSALISLLFVSELIEAQTAVVVVAGIYSCLRPATNNTQTQGEGDRSNSPRNPHLRYLQNTKNNKQNEQNDGFCSALS
jgi:hypothetical protein